MSKVQATIAAIVLLRLSDVEAVAGIKKSKIYNLMAEGAFPQPVRLGSRSVRWKSSELNEWIKGLSSSAEAGK